MTAPAIDISYLRSWIGKSQTLQDDMSPFAARALWAALEQQGLSASIPKAGAVLPPAWQWLYFLETPLRTMTGTDGHPKTGGFLPPVPLKRRMWAAGEFEIHRPLILGVPAVRTSIIENVELKEGSTGPLIFVTVSHAIEQSGVLALSETQTIVYRDMPAGPSPLPPGKRSLSKGEWVSEINPDAILLFRYSALTYNSHRIHYDRPYAVDEEFYPGLVVQGPLQATLLANSVLQQRPEQRISRFEFRAMRPLFDGQPFAVCGRQDGETLRLWTRDRDGFIGMDASATLSEISK